MFRLALLSFLSLFVSVSAAEPQWLHDWQQPLTAWLKQLQPEELEVQVQAVDPAKLDDANARFAASQGYGHMLVSKIAGVLDIPPEAFTWSQIWQPGLPLEQAVLTDAHHGLESGQILLPSHPTAANWLGWAYSNEESWNPYHGHEAIARRAAVISVVDLLMQAESHYYYHDPASSKEGRRWGIHQGIMGFTLTFNALTMLQVQAVLPPEVREAWRTGFKFMASETVTQRPTGPANMRISLPVALYYAYLATEDEDYLTWYHDWEKKVVFGSIWSPAGVYIDGGAPDASYNGIALHRVAELYAINPSDSLRGLLEQAYALYNYMSLPEPDGHLLAPSHFNDRCASSFPNDQYWGREVIFALDVPAAIPALRQRWRQLPPDVLTGRIVKASGTPSGRATQPHPWGTVRTHNWQPVLALPYAMYHQDIPQLEAAMANSPGLPVQTDQRYERSFHDQFFSIRRPGYAALFYAGPVSDSDSGRTNYRNMLKDRGGWFNGFAGGGLSAFWVEDAGSLLIGRMNQYENYERDTMELPFGTYKIPGWQDWLNNHLIGQTQEGKILTSARCKTPEGKLAEDGGSLSIKGQIPNTMRRQGPLFDGQIAYQRDYTFHDDRLACKLSVTSDTAHELKSFYETLPVRVSDDITLAVLDAGGQALEVGASPLAGVGRLQLRRGQRGVDVVFPEPVTLSLLGEPTKSRQSGPAVFAQAIHVNLPKSLKPGEPIDLRYDLVPWQDAD